MLKDAKWLIKLKGTSESDANSQLMHMNDPQLAI